MTRYGTPDPILENEKLEFSEYALNNLQGVVLRDWGGGLDYVSYIRITESPEKFKSYEINSKILAKENSFKISAAPYGETLEELISDGEKYDLKYIIANQKKGLYYPFTDELFYNYNQYPYFKKLKIKVFEINYEKFHE